MAVLAAMRRLGPPIAGPALIVGAVLVVLRDIAIGGLISAQHVDVLSFWLPTHCYLGSSLAAGDLPAWNPHVLGGTPFAADPQSGWMYAPAMILYTLMPCAAALRWFVVAQPILAGLGAYAFLRSEGLSRPAATTGGLTLALVIAASALTLALPFAGTLAWTAILLAAASRLVHAGTWPLRFLWVLASSAAWGQLAAAHLSDGLILGTTALAVYLTARLISDLRARQRTGRQAIILVILIVAALLLVNSAVLLPRLAYLPRTSLAVGYGALPELAARYGGEALSRLPGPAAGVAWPLLLAVWPGAYLGGAALLLTLFWLRRISPVPIALAALGITCYFLSLRAVSEALVPLIGSSRIGQVYLHAPWRLRFGVILALPLLIGYGLDSWRSDGSGSRARMVLLAPAILLWLVLPTILGERVGIMFPLIGGALGGMVLWTVARRPRLSWLVPGLISIELVTAALFGQHMPRELVATGLEQTRNSRPLTPLIKAKWPAADYVAPSPVATALPRMGEGRFLSVDPDLVDPDGRGYLGRQRPKHWGLMTNQRAMLFGLEDAQGYNPVQLRRYWLTTRSASARRMQYNTAVLVDPPGAVRRLLHVTSEVVPAHDQPVGNPGPNAVYGRWAVTRSPVTYPRATVHTAWTISGSPREALKRILEPWFNPEVVVLERDPRIPSTPQRSASARADFRWAGSARAIVDVDTPAPAIVLVRNSYDRYWTAEIDGQEADVMVADFFIQGIPVPAGRHRVILMYRDPWIGIGLFVSAVSVAALVLASIGASYGRTRRRSSASMRSSRSPSSTLSTLPTSTLVRWSFTIR